MAAKLTAGMTPADVERELGPPDYVGPTLEFSFGLGFYWGYDNGDPQNDGLTVLFSEDKIIGWSHTKDGNKAGGEVFSNESANP